MAVHNIKLSRKLLDGSKSKRRNVLHIKKYANTQNVIRNEFHLNTNLQINISNNGPLYMIQKANLINQNRKDNKLESVNHLCILYLVEIIWQNPSESSQEDKWTQVPQPINSVYVNCYLGIWSNEDIRHTKQRIANRENITTIQCATKPCAYFMGHNPLSKFLYTSFQIWTQKVVFIEFQVLFLDTSWFSIIIIHFCYCEP